MGTFKKKVTEKKRAMKLWSQSIKLKKKEKKEKKNYSSQLKGACQIYKSCHETEIS
jgi:hypothetical protein